MSDLRTTTEVLAGVDLTGRRMLVTGATTGLGRETARALLAAGATVVITARDDSKAAVAIDELKGLVPDAEVSAEVLDLSDLDSVRAGADRLLDTGEPFDVLIANAGIMAVPFDRTAQGFELQFGTNHLGHFVLVGRLLPLMLDRGPTRVVMLSSAGHSASDIRWEDPNFDAGEYSKMEAYGQSKTANILHAVELDRRFAANGLHAWSVHPGMVSTDLGRHFTRDDVADLVARARAAGGELPSPVGVEIGASTTVWAATSDEVLDHGGAYLADCAVAEARPWAVDADAARRLWALSEQLVGESFGN